MRAEGLRPLAARTGIPIGQIRSLIGGRAVRSTTLERVTSVLGLEFYIGPPRGGGASPLPPEIANVLRLPETATVAEAVQRIDLDTVTSELRATIAATKEFVNRAAAAANILPRLESPPPASRRRAPAPRIAMIPFASEVRRARGDGRLLLDESTELQIGVLAEALAPWARSDRLVCIRAADDAMEPTMHEGELVAIDRGWTDPIDEQLFAVASGTTILVRRLRYTDRWLLAADNPARGPVPLSPNTRILGQVAWRRQQNRNRSGAD